MQELAEDTRLLQEALEREHQAELREQDLKALRREQMREYRRHIEAMMIKEKEDSAEQDRMIQAYAKEQQDREDAARQRQEDARAKLMEEVMLSRQEQIRIHEEARLREREELLLERLRHEEQSAELARIEEEFQHRRKMERITHRMDIQAQVLAKEQRRRAEEEEKRAAFEKAKMAEVAYTSFVQKAASEAPQRWYGRKAFNWFD